MVSSWLKSIRVLAIENIKSTRLMKLPIFQREKITIYTFHIIFEEHYFQYNYYL